MLITPKIQGLLLSYVGLPPAYAQADLDDVNIAVLKNAERAIKTVNEMHEGGMLLINGDGAYLLKLMVDTLNIPLEKLGGIDFAEYFASKFNNDNDTSDIVAKKFTFVYNVGDEEALKRDYPAQVLKGICKRVVNQNCWVIVVTDKAKSAFERDYGMTFVNSLALPKKKEVAII